MNEVRTLVVIGTDCTSSCKSNIHPITTTTAPPEIYIIYVWVVVVVIGWYLDVQLPVQSVPITTNVASLHPAQAGCTRYNIR